MKNFKRVVISLVCFTPAYKEKSLFYLSKLANNLADEVLFCVIYNSEEVKNTKTAMDHVIDNTIEGSNVGWEFSAWDESLEYMEQSKTLNADDLILFANDTFCHHWPFSSLNVKLISRSVNKLRQSQLIGDIKKFKQTVKLNEVKGNAWIASYLFACQYQDLAALKPFDKVRHLPNFEKEVSLADEKVKIGHSCEYIESHLTNYLFPKNPDKGWYKSHCNDPEVLRLKCVAIINEILLSVTAANRGVKLVPLYPQKWMRSLTRLRRKLSKL